MRSNPTYDEFRRGVNSKVNGSGSKPTGLSQERVAAEYLTGSDEWDVFLQQVQAIIEDQLLLAEKMEMSILDPGEVSHDNLMELKIRLAYHTGAANSLQRVLDIPRKVLES